ncbi:hypothetical protein GCM10027346_06330 [Hymenobacter seoulensis]
MNRPSIRQLLGVAALGLLLVVLGAAWFLGSQWGKRRLELLIRQRVLQQSELVLAPFELDISLLRDFPHLTASARHISLTDTSYQRAVEVLLIGRADMRLELRQIWRGEFQVKHLTLRDVEFRQLTDSLGHDWGLRGRGPRRTTPSAPPNLLLDSLILLNVRVLDRNELHKSGFSAYVRQGRLSGWVQKGVAHVTGQLQGQLEYLRSGRGNLFEQEAIVALVRYSYDFRRREGTFRRTKATLNGDTVLVTGTHRGAAPHEPRGTYLNVQFRGSQPLLEVLHVALPPSLDRFLQGAKSPSHAQIWYSIKGQTGPTTRPRTILRFALRDAQVQWADSARRIRRWDARGTFDNGSDHAPRTTSLTFDHCRIYSEAGELDASLLVQDFTRPHLLGHIRGRTELTTLAAVVVPHLWRASSGQATLDLKLDGAFPEIPNRAARRALDPDSLLPPMAARGTVRLENAAFSIPSRQATMKSLNVRVQLRDSMWVLENLTGQLNSMHVRANATASYLLAYFSGQRATTRITGSFGVDELNLQELRRLLAAPNGRPRTRPKVVRPVPTTAQQRAARALNILPPGLLLNVRVQCGRLVVAADTLEQLAATVRHNGQQVHISNLHGQVWGGTLTGAVSWLTDTLAPQPVMARLAVFFPTLRYHQLLERLTRPSQRPAGTSAADPTLREILLSANGQATATIRQLQLPDSNYLQNIRLRMDKNGPSFLIPHLTFTTDTGGKGQLSATARLDGTQLARAHADLDMKFAMLDVQNLLQLLAALSSVPATATPTGNKASRQPSSTSPFLDGTLTGRVHVLADQIRYGVLRGRGFELKSSLAPGRAHLEECAVQVLGGQLRLRGTLHTDAGPERHPLHSQVQLQDIQLPELFALAQMLGLDVLGPQNIRGQMRCEADVHTSLDRTFLPHLAQTKAFLSTDLRNLELIEVEAIMQALKMLNEKRTSHLYFEPVRPRFVLDDGRLLIPGMGLSSNLTDMTISGVYQLDGRSNLYIGLSPMQALLGNNRTRIERIQSGEATQRPNRGLMYMNLSRTPGTRYKVRVFQKQEQRQQQQKLQQEFQRLLRQQPLDTTMHLLR